MKPPPDNDPVPYESMSKSKLILRLHAYRDANHELLKGITNCNNTLVKKDRQIKKLEEIVDEFQLRFDALECTRAVLGG